MRATAARRVRFAWHAIRYFSRMLVEYVATVWLLGIAPFLAHLAAASPSRGYAWIPNDLYLFVMVVGGNTAIEAFKDRDSDGPSRPLAAVLGVSAVIVGATAFGALEGGVSPVVDVLRWLSWRAAVATLGIDLCCRVRLMMRCAISEAAQKGAVW